MEQKIKFHKFLTISVLTLFVVLSVCFVLPAVSVGAEETYPVVDPGKVPIVNIQDKLTMGKDGLHCPDRDNNPANGYEDELTNVYEMNTALRVGLNVKTEGGDVRFFLSAPNWDAYVATFVYPNQLYTGSTGGGGTLTTIPSLETNTDYIVELTVLTYCSDSEKTTPVHETFTVAVLDENEKELFRKSWEFAGPGATPAMNGNRSYFGFLGQAGTDFTLLPVNYVEIVDYQITYELDGGTNDVGNRNTYTVLDEFTFLKAQKAGYIFDGWYDETGNRVSGVAAGTTGDLHLFARYIKAAITLNGTYQNVYKAGDELTIIPGVCNDTSKTVKISIKRDGENVTVSEWKTVLESGVYTVTYSVEGDETITPLTVTFDVQSDQKGCNASYSAEGSHGTLLLIVASAALGTFILVFRRRHRNKGSKF